MVILSMGTVVRFAAVEDSENRHSRLVSITGSTVPAFCESDTARNMKIAPGRPPSISRAAARKAFPTEQFRKEKCLCDRLRMRVLKWTRKAKQAKFPLVDKIYMGWL